MDFDLALPNTLNEAFGLKDANTKWFAGGTDLIPEIKSDLAAPARLVNLKGIAGLHGIHIGADQIRIGALTTLSELIDHAELRTVARALVQACEVAASPQIRNVATLGGNLVQDSRCPYYRNGYDCYLRGGDTCYMRDGENREAAVIGYHDCVHVHPSDPATALVALEAEVVLQSRAGERRLFLSDFFHAPDAQDRRMTVLNDEVITAIVFPHRAGERRSAYVKAMDRATWAFALASAAVVVELDNAKVSGARVVLGGVAPTPWQEFRVAQTLSGAALNEDQIVQAAEQALTDAQPLAHNHYKIRLARALIKRALRDCL